MRWCAMSLGLLIAASAQAQTAVGRTEGEAGVTTTGSARYSIPLALPPGTNGLAPSLAIDYDSRAGHGLLGAGFRLSGISRIHRCGSTLAQDGRIAAVALERADRFCLDGERLRLASGTHGSSGSQYRTEVEQFARITAVGTAGNGPASFRVERRDGLVYEYGATADSRVESPQSSTPREWALNRIRDRDGNHADFTYAEDTASGVHRPVAILYAGNLLTGAQPYYRVGFVYEARPAHDVPSRQHVGAAIADPLRLDRIDVLHVASGRTVRSYDLSYATPGSTGRSRLAAVQECAGSTCLPATQFTWSGSTAGWGVSFGVPIGAAQLAASIPGDIDGDGFDDLAYQDAASRRWRVLRGSTFGFLAPAIDTGLGADGDGSQALSADVDGDGRRDVLVPGSGNYWHRLRWSPAGGYQYNATGVINPAPPGGLIAADIDGDGRDDLVYVKAGGSAIYWRRNQTAGSSSYAAEAVLWTVPAGTQLTSTPFLETVQRFRSIVRSGDFNGDGRVDLLVRAAQSTCGTSSCQTWVNRWLLLASTGSALSLQYGFDGNGEALLADFNGDGLTDVGYRGPSGYWEMLLGSGSRGAAQVVMAGPIRTAAALPSATGTMIVDWDADGRADLLQPAADGGYHYCRSTGTSLEPCQPAGIAASAATAPPVTLDLSGDGYADLVYDVSGVRLHLHYHVPPDLLVQVTDGLGQRTTFEYSPLGNPAVHRAGTAAVFPVRDVAKGGHVVSRATYATGAREESYFYEGAQVHVQGRGFLGFARRTVTPTDTRPVRVEEYLQDPLAVERIGAPSRITLQQASGRPLSRTTFAWARLASGSGTETRAFGYPATVTQDRFELDGVRVSSTVTRNTVDSYGTVVQQQVTTTEHAKGSNPLAQHVDTTTLTGVVNDTTHWCLGRPAATQVTRRHGLPGGAPVTRSVAHTWDYARCRATQHVVEPSSTDLRVTTSLAHDAYGNLASAQVTPVGLATRSTTIAWTDGGRFPRSVTDPEGQVQLTEWDGELAQPVTATDPNGLVTRHQYDELGRLVRQLRPDGTSTTLARTSCAIPCPWYGTAWVLTASERDVADAPLVTRAAGFDVEGRGLFVLDELPGGARSLRVLRYDSRGLLTDESVPGPCCATPTRWVRHSYDILGRRTATERPTSELVSTPVHTRWQYDGLEVTGTDPLGRRTTRRHDALGRVLQVVDPALARTDYEYDAFGNLVRTRDAAGSETVASYDLRGFRRSLSDPNAGFWTFDYWPAGELRSQRSPRGDVTSYAYDRSSRPITRDEPEGRTTWTWGASVASRNVGALAAVSSPGFQETYQYDALGRPAVATTTIAGTTLVTRRSYAAATGLPDVLTYPSAGTSSLRVRHHFDRGRLVRLSDADSGATYWQLDAANSLGHPSDETLGNGVRVLSTHDAVTGRLATRTAGPGGGSTLQNLAYAWDAVGNLVSREERSRGVLEQFHYDDRDRLDYVTRAGSVVLDLAYDEVGNLTYKSDVGTYRYDTTRRQQVVAAGSNTYAYDANGAVVDASGTSIQWLSYDLPGQLAHPGGNLSLLEYGPDRARYRQVAGAGGVVTETLYAAGGLYERVTTGGVTTHRHHIVADGRRVAVQTRRSGSAPVTVYLLEDHLGGVDGLTSASGQLLSRLSYQPYGARRSGDWLGAAPTAGEWQQIQAVTARGYTDHEHLDNLGVVHMNGRVYDPVLGRFLSPDPMVQAPFDTQGLNRYGYVRNNPLRYTDPSGYCVWRYDGFDSQAQPCAEQVFIEGSSLAGWDRFRLQGLFQRMQQLNLLQGRRMPPGQERGPPVTPGSRDGAGDPDSDPPIETITVSATHVAPALPLPYPAWQLLGRYSLTSRALLALASAGAIASVLATPTEISETSDLLDEDGQPYYVYHFTNSTGQRGISTSGFLMPGGSGRVYFSPIPYATGSQAQAALSLPTVPVGYFMIPRSNIPGPLTWSVVGPNFGQPGGGLESSYGGLVPTAGSQWVPIGR